MLLQHAELLLLLAGFHGRILKIVHLSRIDFIDVYLFGAPLLIVRLEALIREICLFLQVRSEAGLAM